MSKEISAGILCFRMKEGVPNYLLCMPGGPFYFKTDKDGNELFPFFFAVGDLYTVYSS